MSKIYKSWRLNFFWAREILTYWCTFGCWNFLWDVEWRLQGKSKSAFSCSKHAYWYLRSRCLIHGDRFHDISRTYFLPTNESNVILSYIAIYFTLQGKRNDQSYTMLTGCDVAIYSLWFLFLCSRCRGGELVLFSIPTKKKKSIMISYKITYHLWCVSNTLYTWAADNGGTTPYPWQKVE